MSVKWHDVTVAGVPEVATSVASGVTKPVTSGAVYDAVTPKAPKSDLTSISITGSVNNTGSTITAGTFFYLNGALVVAKIDIANNATLTSGTNYEAPTAGALNALKSALDTDNDWIDDIPNSAFTPESGAGICKIHSTKNLIAIEGYTPKCDTAFVFQDLGVFDTNYLRYSNGGFVIGQLLSLASVDLGYGGCYLNPATGLMQFWCSKATAYGMYFFIIIPRNTAHS